MPDTGVNRARQMTPGVTELFRLRGTEVVKRAEGEPGGISAPSYRKWYSPLKVAAQRVWKAYRGGPLPYSGSEGIPFDGMPLRDLHGLSFSSEAERQEDVRRTEEYRKTAPDWWKWRGDLEKLKSGTPDIPVRVRAWPSAGKYAVMGASHPPDPLTGKPTPNLWVPTRNAYSDPDFKYKDGETSGPLRYLRDNFGDLMSLTLAHEVQHMISKPFSEGREAVPGARVSSMDLALRESARKDKDTAREEVEPTASEIKYMMRKDGVNPYGHAARPWLRILFEDRRKDVPFYMRKVSPTLPDAFYDRLLHVIRGVSSTNRQMQRASTYA